jgi:1-acyl-sn-glycerol-3-phosphate acyltransferase
MGIEREHILPVSWAVLRLLTGITVEVAKPVPSPEVQILAAVPHTSHLDTLALLLALEDRARELTVVVKGSYWEDRAAYRLLLSLVAPGYVAVEHGKPKENFQRLIGAIEKAQAEKRKMLLGIYPQGTRQRDHGLESGYAVLSAHTQVPVTPVVIEHTPSAFMQGDLSLFSIARFAMKQKVGKEKNPPVRVSFLEPVYPPANTPVKQAKQEVANAYQQRLQEHDWQEAVPAFVLESQKTE